jgi:hypothetical protein
MGYRRLNDRRVAEIRATVDFPTTWVLTPGGSQKLGFRIEGSAFLAPESGLAVGASWTSTRTYLLGDEEVTVQATVRGMIDMQASKGID